MQPDIKNIQIQLTGFLDKDTAPFCKELWKLFLSAQDSPQGVPKELLEAKKLELIQEKAKRPTMLETAAMNPNGASAICPLPTIKIEETDHEIEAIIAKAAGTTARSTIAGMLDPSRDCDLLMCEIGCPGVHLMAIATYHADKMHHNVDVDEIADLRGLAQHHHPEDQVPHHAVALVPLRADEEIHRDAEIRNESDRGPDHARFGDAQIDQADMKIKIGYLLQRERADKIQEADLVAEVDLHPYHLRLVALEAIHRQTAEAGAGATAKAGAEAGLKAIARARARAGAGAHRPGRPRDETMRDQQLEDATAPQHLFLHAALDNRAVSIWQTGKEIEIPIMG
ncbi:PWI domain-containing protein [Beauveria bassiana ARSEF 2860]|uniref:PWI domain-containing protein n=1 Tax=Beauveria bassiana (strain ARSEF 2860) TaxID=655819 RepID=J5JI43_BEAB2|nr:PWI domain-containing protein [Beauveria bassiana ARSEF 2860]EJP63101.1 PWI domain-containing protein [Beauveria bassiana ARSEF 2860]